MSLTQKQIDALNYLSNRFIPPGGGVLNQDQAPVMLGDELSNSSLGSTSSDITLSVATTGAINNPIRPDIITGGDYSHTPFTNIQASIDSIPKNIEHNITLNVGVGSFQGITLNGFSGKSINLLGSWSIPSISSGTTSGTAGAGSGATVLNKPSGASNWPTDSSLVGMFVVITGGGGFTGTDAISENVGVIKSHTSSQLILVDSLVGLDNTTQFEIVTPGTILNSAASYEYDSNSYLLGIINCTTDIIVRRILVDNVTNAADYGLFEAQSQKSDNKNIELKNCNSRCQYNSNLQFQNTYLKSSQLYIYGQNIILLNNLIGTSSSIKIERFISADVSNAHLDGDDGNISAFSILKGNHAAVGGTINNGAIATPLIVNNINNFSINGSLIGTNSSVSYGAQIDGGGQFNLAGLSVTGSNFYNVYFEDGNLLTYAQISINGAVELNGSYLHWGTGSTVHLSGIEQFGGSLYLYGAEYLLGNAYTEITIGSGDVAHTSPSQANAVSVGYRGSLIRSAAGNGDAIKMWGSLGETIGFGLTGEIENNSGKYLMLYPHTSHKLYLAGVDQGSNAAITINNGVAVRFRADNDGNWRIQVL